MVKYTESMGLGRFKGDEGLSWLFYVPGWEPAAGAEASLFVADQFSVIVQLVEPLLVIDQQAGRGPPVLVTCVEDRGIR